MLTINRKILFFASIVFAAGILIGWLFFGSGPSSHAMHSSITESNTETVWTCSMHPQIRQNEPGKCPICGMDLIPLQQSESGVNPDAIPMSKTAMQLAKISTMRVRKQIAEKVIRMNGIIKADERRIFTQSSHIPGRVEQMLVNVTGEAVKKGQIIAYVYSPELVAAQKELLEAASLKEIRPEIFQAAINKLKSWKIDSKLIENVLKSGQIAEIFPIFADTSGYVLSREVNPGDYIRKGQTLYELADLSRVWALFDVYEEDVPWVRLGEKVRIRVSAIPEKMFQGVISFIEPVFHEKMRITRARVELDNHAGLLKPEMFAIGELKSRLTKEQPVIIIPRSAVLWTGERSIVYVKEENPEHIQFVMREITLGPVVSDGYVVKEGLQEGEEIAVNGTFSIDAAAQLSGKPSMMNPEGGRMTTGHQHGTLKHEDHPQASGRKDATETVRPINPKVKKALHALVDDYLQWKDALTNDDFTEAISRAEKMKKSLQNIDMKLFSGADHEVWMKFQTILNKEMEHLSHMSDLEQLRKVFQQVSVVMIDLVRRFQPYDAPLYVQHCPMADNNRGADWLSLESKIRNPYFGKSMYSCGEVRDTIR